MKNNNRSQLLRSMPMSTLVPRMALPIMASMLVQALYNIVDSMYVSRHNPNELTGVSLAYPIQMLMIALSVGMGVGINSLISRQLGAGEKDTARRTAWNGIAIEVCGSALFLLIGATLSGTFLHLLASDTLNNAEEIREMGTRYLSIVTIGSLGLFMSVCFERMLQSTGNTTLSMITQMSGALTNIVLDPLLIFGTPALGIPEMGVAGAAVATVIGQWVSMTVGFTLNQVKNKELTLRLSEFRIQKRLLRGIIAVGLPSTVMQSIGSVMNVGMNMILSSFPQQGNDAVNVLNIYFKLQSFIYMPVFGLGSAVIAIVGYNFGARLKERIYSCIRVALKWAIGIMLAGMILFLVFPRQLMSLFEAGDLESSSMVAIGVTAMRIICLQFIMSAVGIMLSNVFQAVGKGIYSLTISLCRQMFVLLPAAWLLSKISLDAVWWSFFIAEGVSMTISLLLFRKCDRRYIRPLEAADASAPDGRS